MGTESDPVLSDGVISAALVAARERHAHLEAKSAAIDGEVRVARREVELLEELLAVRDGGPSRSNVLGKGKPLAGPVTSGGRATPHPAVRAAITELQRSGRPLHISELMRILDANGVVIPGSGQQANLIAHLTRSPEIVRTSRGMYGLAEWGLSENVVAPAQRRRVRGKSKADTREGE